MKHLICEGACSGVMAMRVMDDVEVAVGEQHAENIQKS